jgi:hypothetical protein
MNESNLLLDSNIVIALALWVVEPGRRYAALIFQFISIYLKFYVSLNGHVQALGFQSFHAE